MIVRQLSPGEGAVFGRIRLEALASDPISFAADAAEHSAFSEADWERALAERIAFAAFESDATVGLASLVPMTLSRMAHRALVTNVFVSPGCRRRGVASRLMDAVEGHARTLGLVQLELGVNVVNTSAIRFYEGRGFLRFGVVPRGFRQEDLFHDEILMFLPLGACANPA